MSMISSQIDELREMAGKLESYDQGYGTICQALREAADTIWQLRDDLQRANAENAKLRVERDEWHRVAASKQDIIDHMRNANAENAKLRTQLTDVTESIGRMEERCAKLRELAERAWKAAEKLCQAFEGPCRDDGVTIYEACPMGERDEECVYGQLQRELRELGVEVDG